MLEQNGASCHGGGPRARKNNPVFRLYAGPVWKEGTVVIIFISILYIII